MILGGAVTSCLQETNHIIDLAAGVNGDHSVHVYSAHLNKMDHRQAFSGITLYWLLWELCRVAMATGLFY